MVDATGRATVGLVGVPRRAPGAGRGGIFPEYDLAAQARAQEAAAAHGVPTAVPAEYEPDSAVARRAVPRHARDRRATCPGPMPLHDPWITESVDGRGAVSETVVDILAAIHADRLARRAARRASSRCATSTPSSPTGPRYLGLVRGR